MSSILANRLKKVRESKGFSRRKVCEDLGLSESGLYMYETGRRGVTSELLDRFIKYYDVSADYLFGLNPEMNKQGDLFSVKKTPETVPVLGSIGCGADIIKKEDVLFKMPKLFDESFDLVIEGNSMHPEFADHDIVLVRQQPEPDFDGQISVVFIDGEGAVVKRFFQQKNGVKLLSVNPDYNDINIDRWRWEHECEFIGVVIGKVKKVI